MESETEEDGMTVGELEGGGNTIMALPWGTQDSGTGGLQEGSRAGRSNTGKASSAAADEEDCGAAMGQGRDKEKKRRPAVNTGGKT